MPAFVFAPAPCLKGARDHIVFEHQRYGDKGKIQQKHGEAQPPVHAPAEAGDRHHHEHQHHKQDGYGADHAHRVHLDGRPIDDAVQQPRYRQSHGHVEYVAAHRTGYGHVAESLACHNHRGNQVRNGGARRQEGQTHDLGRNARCVAGHVGPPDHQVGEGRYPHDGANEGDRKEALAARRPRVGQC